MLDAHDTLIRIERRAKGRDRTVYVDTTSHLLRRIRLLAAEIPANVCHHHHLRRR